MKQKSYGKKAVKTIGERIESLAAPVESAPGQRTSAMIRRAAIEKLRETIESAIQRGVPVGDIAKEFGMSVRTFRAHCRAVGLELPAPAMPVRAKSAASKTAGASADGQMAHVLPSK